jgi:hypothetical protein
MRTIRIITILLATLAVAAVIAALSISGKWQVKASRHISAPAAEIYPLMNTPSKWPEWSVWNKKTHPNMQMTYEGADAGPGAIQIWHDDNDKGILEIISSDTNQSIEYRLTMGKGLFLMNGRISLSESQQTTLVTWELWGDNGSNLIARLMTLAIKPILKKDLDKGLSNLQQLFTQQP